MVLFKSGIFVAALSIITQTAFAEPIKDNSFLIEEAYNQEAGVVQFVQTWQHSDLTNNWVYGFSNEIPLGDETHQFSYSVPYEQLDSGMGSKNTGLGDILLNYRYQMMNNEVISMAPRLSVIVPTGDHKKSFGNGTTGVQFNQSISINLSDKWVNHWNMGFTYLPNARNSMEQSASLFGFNFASSLVYLWKEKTNLLCEFVSNTDEDITGNEQKNSATSFLVVPGIRTAFNFNETTEIVPGIGFPIGLGPSAVDHEMGIFVYLSIEPKLW